MEEGQATDEGEGRTGTGQREWAGAAAVPAARARNSPGRNEKLVDGIERMGWGACTKG